MTNRYEHFFPTISLFSNQFPSVGHAPGCGIDDETVDWMERIQNSATDDNVDDSNTVAQPPSKHQAPYFIVEPIKLTQPLHKPSSSASSSSTLLPKAQYVNNISRQSNTLFDNDFKYPYEKYSKEANVRGEDESFSNSNDWHTWSHDRVRRATTRKDDNRNTCSLYIQTDPLIWRHIREGVVDVSNLEYRLQ